jgi:hypothetical protein
MYLPCSDNMLIQHDIEEDYTVQAIVNIHEKDKVDVVVSLLNSKNNDYVQI